MVKTLNNSSAVTAHLSGTNVTPDQVISQLQAFPAAYSAYRNFPAKYREEFLDFCCGKTSLYLCYDAFFHYVFDTNRHCDRIEQLLSALLGQEIHILEVLPREGSQMAESGSEVIVDLLVRLADKSLVNLEIQKYGYSFPAKRMDCYCADLIMREYNRLHNKYKKGFSYQKLHPIIAIVLMEVSPSEFAVLPDIYIHHGKTTWDSGLNLPGLTRQIYVCLDKFKHVMQNKYINNPLEEWLTLLTAQSLARIDELVGKFPDFADIYRDVFEFRTRPEELIHMYSEVLAAADRNMDRMMIDEMREKLEQAEKALAAETAEKSAMAADLKAKDADIAAKDADLAAKDADLAAKDADIALLREENRRLKAGK